MTRPDQTRPDQTRPDQNYAQIPVVAVVMSTYNGEKYLSEQIDSILAQRDVRVELFIRDDGSSDSTRDIITKFAEKNKNIHADLSVRIGVVESFMEELSVAFGFDYYAFSDQDDVWKPEKLITGIKAIMHEEERGGKNIPVTWLSGRIVTDGELNILFTRSEAKRLSSLESFLMRPYGSGNSIVFNARVRELMEKIYTFGRFRGSYDFLATIVSHAFGGSVIFSEEAYVFYRRHGKNVSNSAPLTFFSRLTEELKQMRRKSGGGTLLAAQLLRACGDEISPSLKKTLVLATGHNNNFIYRLRILFSTKFRTGDLRLTLLGKLKALLGIL